MEDLFDLLATRSTIPDGELDLPSIARPAHAARAARARDGGRSADGSAEEELAERIASNGAASPSSPPPPPGRGGEGGRQRGGGVRVELDGVEYSYSGGRKVLDGVSLVAEEGQVRARG
jgi:hypothetical protein